MVKANKGLFPKTGKVKLPSIRREFLCAVFLDFFNVNKVGVSALAVRGAARDDDCVAFLH